MNKRWLQNPRLWLALLLTVVVGMPPLAVAHPDHSGAHQDSSHCISEVPVIHVDGCCSGQGSCTDDGTCTPACSADCIAAAGFGPLPAVWAPAPARRSKPIVPPAARGFTLALSPPERPPRI